MDDEKPSAARWALGVVEDHLTCGGCPGCGSDDCWVPTIVTTLRRVVECAENVEDVMERTDAYVASGEYDEARKTSLVEELYAATHALARALRGEDETDGR